MGTEHKLARLTAKGIDPSYQSNGGLAEFSQTDIAAAIGFCDFSRFEYLYLLAKYTALSDQELIDELYCWGEAFTLQTFKTSYKKHRFIKRLSELALSEALNPHATLCPSCGGTGLTTKHRECKTCNGHGRMFLPTNRVCQMLKMTAKQYEKTAKPIHIGLNQLYNQMDLFILVAVEKALKHK